MFIFILLCFVLYSNARDRRSSFSFQNIHMKFFFWQCKFLFLKRRYRHSSLFKNILSKPIYNSFRSLCKTDSQQLRWLFDQVKKNNCMMCKRITIWPLHRSPLIASSTMPSSSSSPVFRYHGNPYKWCWSWPVMYTECHVTVWVCHSSQSCACNKNWGRACAVYSGGIQCAPLGSCT